MKKLFTVLCFFVLASCAKKIYSPNVTNNSTTEEGTVRIQANGVGKNEKTAFDKSIQNAFDMLMFKGIPESVQSTPMIPDEAAARQQHAAALNCFTNFDCYKQFITRSAQQGKKERAKNEGFEVTTDVTINVRALRTYLEQNSVIRKFGL